MEGLGEVHLKKNSRSGFMEVKEAAESQGPGTRSSTGTKQGAQAHMHL